MSRVLVIGAGLSGCAAAHRLAESGTDVTLVEKSSSIGGRVRTYGCKATDRCNNCGVCLAGGLWEKTQRHPRIDVVTGATVIDLSGPAGDFSATLSTPVGNRYLSGITAAVVSTGFESRSNSASAHLEIAGSSGIVTGSEMESLMKGRAGDRLFDQPVGSIAFLQCFGSRDQREDAMYCSRVCCAYSTRMAKVVKQYHPECEIAFFYMELQSVANEEYFAGLRELGIQFIKCRPLKITGGSPVVIEYDDPAAGRTTRSFDLAVLSEGIHAGPDNPWMADTYGLQQTPHGFLRAVDGCEGVHVCGCAKTPFKIEESYADAIAVANAILAAGSRRPVPVGGAAL